MPCMYARTAGLRTHWRWGLIARECCRTVASNRLTGSGSFVEENERNNRQTDRQTGGLEGWKTGERQRSGNFGDVWADRFDWRGRGNKLTSFSDGERGRLTGEGRRRQTRPID